VRLKLVNVGGDDDIMIDDIMIDEMAWYLWANEKFDDLMRNR